MTDSYYLRVPQKDVQLLPSVPRVLHQEGHGEAAASTTSCFPLLPELARHPEMRVFRPYLQTLPEEDQMAVALRLEMEHMRDIFILDRTIGYGVWAEANPEAHRAIQAAKPSRQTLVLPPRLDDLLEMLPGGLGGEEAATDDDDDNE